MAYNAFDPALPDGSHSGPTVITEIKNNLLAMRDAVVAGMFKGWNYGFATASFSATISGTTLTVVTMGSGQIVAGQVLSGAGITAGTTIVAQLSGTQFGAAGATFQISASHTIGTTTSMTCANGSAAQPAADKHTNGSEILLSAMTYSGDFCTSEELWYFNGTAWDRIGKETYTFDGNNFITASTWS